MLKFTGYVCPHCGSSGPFRGYEFTFEDVLYLHGSQGTTMKVRMALNEDSEDVDVICMSCMKTFEEQLVLRSYEEPPDLIEI